MKGKLICRTAQFFTDNFSAAQTSPLKAKLSYNRQLRHGKTIQSEPKIFVSGLVIGELSVNPSSLSMEKTLPEFLTAEKILCLYDVDTRALTKKIRLAGKMKGVIVSEYTSQSTINEMMALPIRKNVVEMITTPVSYTLDAGKNPFNVVAMDFGIKRNILDALRKLNCRVTVVPAKTTAEEILKLIREVHKLLNKRPIFGIQQDAPD